MTTPHKPPYAPFESALVLINVGDERASGSTSDHRAGDVFAVRKKILAKNDEGETPCIGGVHCLIGPTDMIAHVSGNATANINDRITSVLRNVDRCIGELRIDVHDWVEETEIMLIEESSGARFDDPHHVPVKTNAWIFIQTGKYVEGHPSDIMTWARKYGVHFAARVIGRYDLALLVKADDLAHLESAVDEMLRSPNANLQMAKTDTRLVLMNAVLS